MVTLLLAPIFQPQYRPSLYQVTLLVSHVYGHRILLLMFLLSQSKLCPDEDQKYNNNIEILQSVKSDYHEQNMLMSHVLHVSHVTTFFVLSGNISHIKGHTLFYHYYKRNSYHITHKKYFVMLLLTSNVTRVTFFPLYFT